MISGRLQVTLPMGAMAAALALAALLGMHLYESDVAHAHHEIEATDVLSVTYIQLDGKGDSTLVQLPNEKTVLIDGGLKKEYALTLKPLLDRHGIDTIDLVIVTHKDQDHTNGINGILEADEIAISEIWYSPELANNTITRPLYASIERKDIPLTFPVAGDRIRLDDRIHMEILSPSEPRQFDTDNDNSAVTLLEYGDIEFLFTGDIEDTAEQWLIDNTPADKLDVDIMNSPHHGSIRTSNTQAFIAATSPELVIFSADEDNSHGHPHDETRERYESNNVDHLQTGIDGHIDIRTDGTRCSILFTDGTELACFEGVLKLSDALPTTAPDDDEQAPADDGDDGQMQQPPDGGNDGSTPPPVEDDGNGQAPPAPPTDAAEPARTCR